MAERRKFNWTKLQGKAPAAGPVDDDPKPKPKRKRTTKPKDN